MFSLQRFQSLFDRLAKLRNSLSLLRIVGREPFEFFGQDSDPLRCTMIGLQIVGISANDVAALGRLRITNGFDHCIKGVQHLIRVVDPLRIGVKPFDVPIGNNSADDQQNYQQADTDDQRRVEVLILFVKRCGGPLWTIKHEGYRYES